MRRILDSRSGGILTLVAGLLLWTVSGCNPGDGRSADASPIVSADSEQGKRAIAEAEGLYKLRKAQEAKLHTKGRNRKRHRDLPKDE